MSNQQSSFPSYFFAPATPIGRPTTHFSQHRVANTLLPLIFISNTIPIAWSWACPVFGVSSPWSYQLLNFRARCRSSLPVDVRAASPRPRPKVGSRHMFGAEIASALRIRRSLWPHCSLSSISPRKCPPKASPEVLFRGRWALRWLQNIPFLLHYCSSLLLLIFVVDAVVNAP